MDHSMHYRQQTDLFEIEYEVLLIDNYLSSGETEVDELLSKNQKWMDEINENIDNLRVDADRWDYAVSTLSGVLAGVIDLIFVGEITATKIDINKAASIGKDEVEKFVIRTAKRAKYDGDDLLGAVKHLEENFKIGADCATNFFGGGTKHHLHDFSHHPTPVGLLFSLITQFSGGYIWGTDNFGNITCCKLQEGSIYIGKNFEQKIMLGVIYWFYHMASDMAGSSKSIKKGNLGTGVPGPIVSLLKELSVLPIFGNKNEDGRRKISEWIQALFDGKVLGTPENPKPFDLRMEIGLFKQISDNIQQISVQFIPVIINECIVRTFYFLKRLCKYTKELSIKTILDIKKLPWEKIVPTDSATLTRMLTISVGTMEVLDLSGAVILGTIDATEAAGASAETGYGAIAIGAAAFAKRFALNINFVGIGRFVICIIAEMSYEKRRQELLSERIAAYDNRSALLQSKLWFREADMWIEAEKAEKVINEVYKMITVAEKQYADDLEEIRKKIDNLDELMDNVEAKNPGLTDSMLNALKWGV